MGMRLLGMQQKSSLRSAANWCKKGERLLPRSHRTRKCRVCGWAVSPSCIECQFSKPRSPTGENSKLSLLRGIDTIAQSAQALGFCCFRLGRLALCAGGWPGSVHLIPESQSVTKRGAPGFAVFETWDLRTIIPLDTLMFSPIPLLTLGIPIDTRFTLRALSSRSAEAIVPPKQRRRTK